jgi:hypothetical protein
VAGQTFAAASHLDAISNACYSCSRGRRPRLFEDSAF